MKQRRFPLIILSLAAVLGLVLVIAVVSRPDETSVTAGRVNIGGPFTLTNQEGLAVSNEDFRGGYTLVYFGYTYCPDLCPTELQTITFALEELGDDAEKITPLFVTVDPARDTVEAIQDYVSYFHPRLVGLMGTDQQIAQVTKAYGIFYAVSEDDGSTTEYLMDHTTTMYLMGPDGQYRTHLRAGMTAEEMAAAIKPHL
jgi:protein SCO1/2